jgi:hypothetical protein
MKMNRNPNQKSDWKRVPHTMLLRIKTFQVVESGRYYTIILEEWKSFLQTVASACWPCQCPPLNVVERGRG